MTGRQGGRHTLAVIGAAFALALLSPLTTLRAIAQDTTPDAAIRSTLAPTGKLRAALYPGTPTSILKDEGPASRGVGFELGRELAARLGVPYEPLVFAKNADVLDAVTRGAADAAFTNASAERAQKMDFGPPYLDIELGYLAARGSPVKTIDDVDRPERRVGVTLGSSSQGLLTRAFKNARVVPAEKFSVAIAMLNDGKIDVFATNKATLFEMMNAAPGSQVLDGRWGLERHAIAIPKGRDSALAFLRVFTDEMKRRGFVAGAIARAGLKGAMVSP